jgi:hypothetical protein
MDGTMGNPALDALQVACNTMEGGAGVVVCLSGLLAFTLPLLATLSAGDHMLVTDSVYRPTRTFSENMLRRMGVVVSCYDPLIGKGSAAPLKPTTTVVFTQGAWLADLRDAGCSGHCESRPQARRAGHHGQHLGDAAVSARSPPERPNSPSSCAPPGSSLASSWSLRIRS